jgi:putative ABC transport system substrate-binding protein
VAGVRRREFIGGVAVWPLAARAQNTRMPLIGMLSLTGLLDAQVSAFHNGLGESGYVEGRNLTILFYSADGDFDRLPALAADLVNR